MTNGPSGVIAGPGQCRAKWGGVAQEAVVPSSPRPYAQQRSGHDRWARREAAIRVVALAWTCGSSLRVRAPGSWPLLALLKPSMPP